jgi:alpha-1,3/alpha-1,6-mannosyltransferase
MIAVNSKFTCSVFKREFPNISGSPKVLYPGIRLEAYDKELVKDASVEKLTRFSFWSIVTIPLLTCIRLCSDKRIVLSINRFERKKNINLAVSSFARLKSKKNDSSKPLILVVAGIPFLP